eukprot:gnl/TRDRNA2_/TRDRNA2_170928_c1_seq6.p1 gnl/TRDRNA2_/TRDRNA2_170928_c1~~gnl/TRDRNA2_/TRDRNA2_170928_c1_seq6.p1  ORF type:complete len:478 (+),score=81.37 gnl/TRDRNA2_/TRDRNA2_170928_c1_seq6:78-1436(+)
MLAGVYYVLCVRPSASVSLGNGPDGQLIRMGRATEHAKLGVYVRDFDDTGRGLAAATSFASGDVIIQMPLTEAAYIGKHNLYFDLHNVGTLLKGGQGTKQVLALALLFERQKPDTPWASFFSLLPTNVSNIAAMNDLHRRILNRTDLAKKFQDFDEIFQSTARFVKSAGWFFSTLPTDDEVRWALSIVESRAHDRPGGKERIIWPFLVLANHHYEQSRTMTYKTIQGNPTVVQLRSQEPVRAGDQVFLHYGAHSNLRLLLQYGFTIPGNPILDPLAIQLARRAGPGLFTFGNKLAPRGPSCMQLRDNVKTSWARSNSQVARLPDVFLRCWRLSRFESLDSAQVAVGAGMFDEGGDSTGSHIGALKPEWIERDAEAHSDLAEACLQVRDAYAEGGVSGMALQELKQLTDSLSVHLYESILAEVQAWEECFAEMTRRAAAIRLQLGSSPAAPQK